MDVLLLGTGAADGWPNPFCGCASCASEAAAGRVRGQTSALLDGTLLLDCGPETPRAAVRAGVDLAGVRHVLLTHPHPDHCSPAFLLFRSWTATAVEPLDVVGPPAVVEACRPWVAPDAPVRFVTVQPGDTVALTSYDVRVLAADHGDDAVLYDVRGPGGRLLYATDTGPLPEAMVTAVQGAAFDVALIEETFGDKSDHGTEHLDLRSFPEQLRRLRAVGAIHDGTDVVAVHLSHHNPPTPELGRRLAAWGARTVPDGTRLENVTETSRPDETPRRTLVLGGARSGKSREAERLLAAEPSVGYVATSYPVEADATDVDPEWAERVARHRQDRPDHWRTVETLDLVGLLAEPGDPLLIDCLTLWLTRVMDRHHAWDDAAWQASGETAVEAEVTALVEAWRSTRRRVVAVSNEVGQGVVPDTASGRRFRDQMGRLNARVAAASEDVRFCVAGRVQEL